MHHFGDPCIHCDVPQMDVIPGPCNGDPAKAKPIAYCVMETRPDGVERYRVRMSSGSIMEQYRHVSEHAPYYHFGHSDDLIQPPRYDRALKAISA